PPAPARGAGGADRRVVDDEARAGLAHDQIGRHDPIRLDLRPRHVEDRGDGEGRLRAAGREPGLAGAERATRVDQSNVVTLTAASSGWRCRRRAGLREPLGVVDRRLPAREPREEPLEVLVDEKQSPMALGHETLGYGVVEERLELGEIIADVEQADGLRVQVELRPAQDLGELLERPEAAG